MPCLPHQSFRLAEPRLLTNNLPRTIHTILSDHLYVAKNIRLFQYRQLVPERVAIIRCGHKGLTLRGK